MRFLLNRNVIRWLIIVSSFVIVSLILWNTYVFFNHFKSEERAKLRSWTIAYPEFASAIANSDEDLDINRTVNYLVTETNITAPMLLVDHENNIILHRNIFAYPRLSEKNEFAQVYNDSIDDIYVKNNKMLLISKFREENSPLEMKDIGQTLYYGNSPLLNKLKYYPLALLSIIVLFAAVVYFFYRSSKNAEQNKLWTGMAKETAHQIGTPLSSLVGWTEILKSENINPEYIREIEKDIDRLKTITERFSKIGSVPELTPKDIVTETKKAIDYLESRNSKLIQFSKDLPDKKILVKLNKQLFSWTIENLVKNAIDAMKGKGKLTLKLVEKDNTVYIQVSDTGQGIQKSQFNRIFQPGFTTKKRGWGLGLSLAKRIIEDYHNGKIKVLKSEIGKGTTFQIQLKTVT